jgi:prepilin-type N-terminal cleavage/methylation domain-containing protein
MKQTRPFTPAFSMLELIFVIVILGIVASIGSEMIAKVYESYIVQRAQHSATLKTELAAAQIANRLASAIPGTVYRITNGNTYESIEANLAGSGDNYKGLQWVGSDAESFNAASTPGWSGFCDINTSTQTSIETPGSALALTNAIKSKLSSSTNLAVYFPDDLTDYNASITVTDPDTLSISGTVPTRIVEHYKLASSSYALVVEGGDLYLYYNFNPTPATPLETTKSLLMKDVATFKFQGGGRTIRFKICKNERISDDVNITACKEKAVF